MFCRGTTRLSRPLTRTARTVRAPLEVRQRQPPRSPRADSLDHRRPPLRPSRSRKHEGPPRRPAAFSQHAAQLLAGVASFRSFRGSGFRGTDASLVVSVRSRGSVRFRQSVRSHSRSDHSGGPATRRAVSGSRPSSRKYTASLSAPRARPEVLDVPRRLALSNGDRGLDRHRAEVRVVHRDERTGADCRCSSARSCAAS